MIPESAIVRDGNDELVYVEQAGGLYRLTKVKLGAESDGMRVVQGGVKTGRAHRGGRRLPSGQRAQRAWNRGNRS
ncbi:hypothetical protein ACU4GD_26080 [Cupriavidus basilensis]